MVTVRRISDKAFIKYNSLRCIAGEYSLDNIEKLQSFYRNVRGVPRFVFDLLNLDQISQNCHRFCCDPSLIRWNCDGTFIVIPNEPHLINICFKSCKKNQLKDMGFGLSLVGWFIHPAILSNTKFSAKEVRENFDCLGLNSLDFSSSLTSQPQSRHPSQRKIKDLEAEHHFKYLASILDLDNTHVQWLKEIRQVSLEHLFSVYGVTNKDNIQMYFHDVYVEKSVTLHLHIRVNQAIHPMEQQRSIGLDDIIDCLGSGRSIIDLVLAKELFYLDIKDAREMKGAHVSVEEIDNPHRISRQWGLSISPTVLPRKQQPMSSSYVDCPPLR